VNARPTFIIKIVSQRGDGIRGLRHVLKRLLRTHGFKCISAVEEIPALPQDSPPDVSGK
jgi:hypothetical protein